MSESENINMTGGKKIKFLLVGAALHKQMDGKTFSYAPFVKEMNLWFKYVDEVRVVGPFVNGLPDPLDLAYIHPHLTFVKVQPIQATSLFNILKSAYYTPRIIWILFREMAMADHIHLRCPGNMGLLAALAQIFFPSKPKTVKYANNWDWNSKQPFTYRLQQIILRNTFLSKNLKTLVYGNWPDKTSNIVPFFTASYSESEKAEIDFLQKQIELKSVIRLVFVGTLTDNKRPLFCLEVLKMLIVNGFDAEAVLVGEGVDRPLLETFIHENGLEAKATLTGKVNQSRVSELLKESHFLIFASMSEGWPKAVAEAMWWGCLPITTNVSCIPFMIGDNERGTIVDVNVKEAFDRVVEYVNNNDEWLRKSKNAQRWARQYTLERFESEIAKMIV